MNRVDQKNFFTTCFIWDETSNFYYYLLLFFYFFLPQLKPLEISHNSSYYVGTWVIFKYVCSFVSLLYYYFFYLHYNLWLVDFIDFLFTPTKTNKQKIIIKRRRRLPCFLFLPSPILAHSHHQCCYCIDFSIHQKYNFFRPGPKDHA